MKSPGFYEIILVAVLCLLCMQGAASGRAEFETGEDFAGVGGPVGGSIYSPVLLFFVPNEGQAAPGVLFTCNGPGYALTFGGDRIGFSLPGDDGSVTRPVMVLQRFQGSNPAPVVEGRGPMETRVSYFTGNESEWCTDITPFGAVLYRSLYPGIDLVYHVEGGFVKREFLVQPTADPSRIRMTYEGASQVRMTGNGGLSVRAGTGEIRESPPLCYQEAGGARTDIPCRFEVGEDGSVSFAMGRYDPALPLVIDPAIVYCGYLGGSINDYGEDIAVDPAGYVYLAGTTISTAGTFPETAGIWDPSSNGDHDAFVAKVNQAGTGLLYCGYLGGSGYDSGTGIAVDSSGNAYVVGSTSSTAGTFPETAGSWDPSHNGDYDAFVAKVNAAGTALLYCGYIGGSGQDKCEDIALDTSGNAYVVGSTVSSQPSFPVSVGPDLTGNGGSDAFVAKVNAAGTALLYSGFIGGSEEDYGHGIAVDGFGSAYVTGTTFSSESTFPETAGSWDPTQNGLSDAFVAKVNPGGSALTSCGFLGGTGGDVGNGIAVLPGYNDIYVTGHTYSSAGTFPVTPGSLDTTQNGGRDAFIAKLNVGVIDYCGYIGGSGDDEGTGIAMDAAGNAYITGKTNTTDGSFPVRGGPDLTPNGAFDSFVVKVNAAGSQVLYGGFVGGSGDDEGAGIAVDTAGAVYIAGTTTSSAGSFPEQGGPDLSQNGFEDAFVAKISDDHGRGVFRSSAWEGWILDRSMDGSIDIRDHYGLSTDIPLLVDLNSDRTTDRVVFRSGDWIVDHGIDGSTNDRDHFGMAGDLPLAGRMGADGITDRAVFRAGEWIFDYSADGSVNDRDHYGSPGDIPLIGDFNNDGNPDRAVFRPSAWENWILSYSMHGAVEERDRFGQAGDIPVVADFNRDGIMDRAVLRAGEWIIDSNMDGSVDSRDRFGMAGDRPLVWSV